MKCGHPSLKCPWATVPILDLQAIAGLWQQPASCPIDQDGDGEVTIVDIGLVVANVVP